MSRNITLIFLSIFKGIYGGDRIPNLKVLLASSVDFAKLRLVTSMDDLGFSKESLRDSRLSSFGAPTMPNGSSAPPKVVQGCDLRMRSKPTENPSLSTLRVQVECFAS